MPLLSLTLVVIQPIDLGLDDSVEKDGRHQCCHDVESAIRRVDDASKSILIPLSLTRHHCHARGAEKQGLSPGTKGSSSEVLTSVAPTHLLHSVLKTQKHCDVP